MFDDTANHAIVGSDNQSHHQNADKATLAAFPDEQSGQNDQGGNEENVATDKGHELVEQRIAESSVYKAEQVHVEVLQPFHRGGSLAGGGALSDKKLLKPDTPN